jgi:hypothetical protein
MLPACCACCACPVPQEEVESERARLRALVKRQLAETAMLADADEGAGLARGPAQVRAWRV